MPTRMKVLYVTTLHRTGGWLAEAFAADCAAEIWLEEAIGVTAGLAQLRDEVFDAVLVSHEPGVLDALDFVEGLRAGGNDEPMIVLGTAPSAEMTALALRSRRRRLLLRRRNDDALAAVDVRPRDRTLPAGPRASPTRANGTAAPGPRTSGSRATAGRAAGADRGAGTDSRRKSGEDVGEWEMQRADSSDADVPLNLRTLPLSLSPPLRSSCDLPERLVTHYREMLRAYVVMGAGNLADEMTTLASLLAEAGISAQRTMQLHVHVLEELIGSLGNRSARHVMNRADLLVLEVMAHLADGYRRRYHDRCHPPRQLELPGF